MTIQLPGIISCKNITTAVKLKHFPYTLIISDGKNIFPAVVILLFCISLDIPLVGLRELINVLTMGAYIRVKMPFLKSFILISLSSHTMCSWYLEQDQRTEVSSQQKDKRETERVS